MSARVENQREDVASLFRKFGGDASEYREFAPIAEPVAPLAARSIAPVAAPAPASVTASTSALAPAPVSAPPVHLAPAASAVLAAPVTAAEAKAVEAVSEAGAPRELDVIFQRLLGAPPVGLPASGLMAVWRRST